MPKSAGSAANQYFGRSQKKDDKLIEQKAKAERDRDGRMARLRDLRLAKEGGPGEPAAAELPAAPETADAVEAPESPEAFTARLPRVHPHQS